MNEWKRFANAGRLMAALVLLSAPPGAEAASASGTFAVQATVLSACSVSATPMTFGVYNPTGGSNVDTTSTISVFCTVGTSYSLKLNIGSGGGTFATRTMASGSDALNFNLYTTTGRTTVWGDGTSSTGMVSGTGLGLLSVSQHTVYGRLPPAQDVPAGSYQSVITVTLDYT